MNSSSHFFKDKPLFGLDIGSSSVKVMQLDNIQGKQPRVSGYGVTSYDPSAVKEGVITDFKSLASSVYELFDKHLIGDVTTRRVAVSIPASRTFTRSISLPEIPDNELVEAVRLEAEQYIPVPVDELFMDYMVTSRHEKGMELLAVAAPKKIVDSYMKLIEVLGLEAVAIDTTILASGRLHKQQAGADDVPTVLIDFGSTSADITIHDKTVAVTGTTPGGGDSYTELIAKRLGISHDEAHIVKTKYGLNKSKKQAEIIEALEPRLSSLVKEIRRMIRYHEERSASKQKIEQIITLGGGANMPGLSDYLTNTLRMPVRTCNPWQHLELGKIQPPNELQKSMYVTVAGLALTSPKELFV